MEFYSTAAVVIPTLLIVAALQSRLLDWAAQKYKQGGLKSVAGRLVMFSLGGSLICEAIVLIVLALNKDSLTSYWWLRLVVLLGCLPALAAAWAGGHMEWMAKRDAR
jgi:hypothetical protein